MEFAFRQAVREDFAAFYDACFSTDQDDAVLRKIVAHEWQVLIKNPATLSMVVEDRHRPEHCRLAGCCQMAFVTDRLVQWAKTSPKPSVNLQATFPLPDGTWPLLTLAQVGEANAGRGLNAVFTRWRYAHWLQSAEDKLDVSRFMHESFVAWTRGYQFRELLIEVIGETAREETIRAGFRERNRYETHHAPCPPPPEKHPFLMGVTREEALETQGYPIGHYFPYHPPRFGFKAPEQRLLWLCLLRPEASEKTLAQALGIPLAKVKNEWRAIYRHVTDSDPDLLPLPEGRERGPEKKRLLMHYLRAHPEELRPYQKPRGSG